MLEIYIRFIRAHCVGGDIGHALYLKGLGICSARKVEVRGHTTQRARAAVPNQLLRKTESTLRAHINEDSEKNNSKNKIKFRCDWFASYGEYCIVCSNNIDIK